VVITRVHQLARRNPRGMSFIDRDHDEIIDNHDSDDDDSSYSPDPANDDSIESIPDLGSVSRINRSFSIDETSPDTHHTWVSPLQTFTNTNNT